MLSNDNYKGTKKGLIIAVSEYENLKNLEFCKDDGKAIYDHLKSIGYEVPDRYKLIGKVEYSTVHDRIIEFFTDETMHHDDTLLICISGYGLPTNKANDFYLSSSEINPKVPRLRGFSLHELMETIQECYSKKIFTILNCFCDDTAANGNTSART